MGNTLWQSLVDGSEKMVCDALKDVPTLEDWKRIRPQRHQEFMRCMGLDPLPQKGDLKIREYGVFSGKGFRGRRIGFQILPDCWASACVYYPDPLPKGRLPGVLYVCGHNTIGIYGFQYHPILWARRGYACLIVDTIEQNDNPGEHHGFDVGRMESWLSMGYTASGGELWNAIRALDVLAADPRVDPERLAVTGVSGGGACSFHLAIADERVKAVSTLCGICTPYDAIANRHLISHCNCMFPINLYRRDTSDYAALIAPRAALFCFADDDQIFHPDETRALVGRTRKVFTLYGQDQRCGLVTCAGGHGDHPEFDEATSRWFDRHVAGDERPLLKLGQRELPEQAVSVFNGQPPSPNRVDLLPQLISTRGTVPLPNEPGDWAAIRRQAVASIPPFPEDAVSAPIHESGTWRKPNGVLASHRGRIGGMDVCLQSLTPTGCSKVVMGIAGPGEGALDLMGQVFTCSGSPGSTASVGFESRLAGVSYPVPEVGISPATSMKWSIRKLLPFAMSLSGVTPVMMTVNDIRAAVDYLARCETMKGIEIFLYGKGDAGVAALYAGLVDGRIAGVILDDPPSSHLDAAPILGILRSFDMPQAVGLMAPRRVALINPQHNCWTWPTRVYERLGIPERLIVVDTLAKAFESILKG